MAHRTETSSRGIATAAVVVLLLATAVLALGCGGDSSQDVGAPVTTVAAAGEAPSYATDEAGRDKAGAPTQSGEGGVGTVGTDVFAASLDRKVIANATLLIEVEQGKFQMAFDQALLLADKYGGYIVASNASASGDEETMRSGTIALRVPEVSFAKALGDAAALGTVMSRQVDTQDVTEEFLDLEARLRNAEAQEKAFLALMERADTIDEILTVRSVLSQTQQEIEQLKGRIRFLDEHTSFSTITLSLYEKGVDTSDGDWGFIDALKDALHAFVDSVSAILVFFGGALPVFALLGFVVWLAYRLIRPLVRRLSRDRAVQPQGHWAHQQFQTQQHYGAPAPYGPPATGDPGQVPASTAPEPAPGPEGGPAEGGPIEPSDKA